MGACETTPTTSHDRESRQATPTPKTTHQERPPFLAPDHRPTLGSVKLVRPRLRPAGAALRALQLDPARATAQASSDEETRHQQSHPNPAAGEPGHRVNSALPLDN